MSLGGGGGGGGQRALEQEEKDLLVTQRQVAEQGIQGRNAANAGYQSFMDRGRELGSLANRNLEADRFGADATASYGNAQRIQNTQMAAQGVNPGDPRFTRGRDTAGVNFAAQTAAGQNQARASARQAGISLEGAGLTGLAGNDPTAALNGMSNTLSGASNRALQQSQNESAGYAALGQGALYGLKNSKEIGQGLSSAWDTVGGWFGAADGGLITPHGVQQFADGGEVPGMGIPRYASGGNVYDRADAEIGGARSAMPSRAGGGAPPQQGPGLGTYMNLYKTARGLVDSTASGLGLTGTAGSGTTLASTGANLASMGGAQGLTAGAAQGLGSAGFGGGLGSAAAAAGGEAAAAGAAGAGAGALGAISTALPWVGGALALGSVLDDLFADGGPVQPRAGIGRNPQMAQGRVMNEEGGGVRGPGGPKDDKVPAWLSSGEFVMPIGAVKKFGLDRLEKMRQAGLEFEKQYGLNQQEQQ